ncbi:Os04g0370900 [Oryza sativa Japonica Group]|uniref:Os04g0370900 protein n=1 Tax=Oryza sativa subsp. japonica TaxID=39947 RepID=Q0JDV9_ORYSJ|nr:Os04g0370900 [Oryza sativa Japonica Group]|eukprot:NP_001052564.2 Os04g0370900 [Oryza sativa Japonica Group]
MPPHRNAAIRGAVDGHICLLIVLFLISIKLAAGGPIARSCQDSVCGGVRIPYPFGISSSGCAMAPSFEVDCNNTANGFKPFVGNVEVISLSNGQARVMNHVSSSCYNRTSRQMNPADVWYLNLTGTPYRLSDSANKFTVIGCRTLAYTFDDYNVGKYMSGCVSVCRRGDLSSAINGSCVGIGCCQTNISTGLSYYEVMFDYTLNTSGIYNRTPCSYAVLMESSSFTFSTTYLTSRAFNTSYGGQAPLVLDWAIRTANNCVEAQKNPASYACKGDYSVCLNSTNGPGYICNCKKGYQGNPYLQDSNGCQGKYYAYNKYSLRILMYDAVDFITNVSLF